MVLWHDLHVNETTSLNQLARDKREREREKEGTEGERRRKREGREELQGADLHGEMGR